MANMTARKKLVVTGAHGFVAGSILAQAGEEWQVHAISRGEPLARQDNLCWHTFDPLAPEELVQIIRDEGPEVVIHTAALADIDLCQTHPEIARAINVDLTRRVASVCTAAGCKLVFCSTDTIFNGEHAPYNEDDLPGPVNFYAETKVEAEQIVARLGPQAVIARLSLVVGLPVLGAGNSFLARMLAAFIAGRTVAVPGRGQFFSCPHACRLHRRSNRRGAGAGGPHAGGCHHGGPGAAGTGGRQSPRNLSSQRP